MRIGKLSTWFLTVCCLVSLMQANLGAASPAGLAGKVVVGSSQEIINTDPAINTLVNDTSLLYANLYDALFIRRADGGLAPQLAESWRQVNPTTWEFKLRKGVTFHDGEPFDANAVKATVDRLLEPGKIRATHISKALKGVTIIDDYTVQIVTPKPEPALLNNSLYWMYILPPRYLKSVGEEGFVRAPIGTGPFRFVSWVKGNRLTLEAYPRYWKGQPKFGTLEIRLIPEIATRVAALRAGEIDVAMQLTPDQIQAIQADPQLRVTEAPVPRTIYLMLWTESPVGGNEPLKDKRVRQALNYAINIDSIIKNILSGQATRIATIVPPRAFAYDRSIQLYPYDPQKAKQLLAEAGYSNGFTVDFDVPNGGNYLKPSEVGQAIAADLAKVGITARLRVVEAANYFRLRNERKVSPIFIWNIYDNDGHLSVWDNAHPDSPNSFYHIPALTKLIDDESSMVDMSKRLAIFKQIQELLKDESPFVPLYQQNDIYGVNRRITWSAKPGGFVYLWDTAIVKQ